MAAFRTSGSRESAPSHVGTPLLQMTSRIAGLALFAAGLTAAVPTDARAQTPPASRQTTVRASVPTVTTTGLPGNVIKTVTDLNGGSALPGDTLVYDISAVNAGGPDDVLNAQILDTLPANTSYAAGSLVITSGPNAGPKTDGSADDQAEYEPLVGNRVRFRIGVGATATVRGILQPGASTSVQFRVVVNAGVPNGTIISNRAVVRYRDSGTNREAGAESRPPGGAPGQATTIPIAIPDLTIAKTHAGNFSRGSSGTYTLTVSNAGPGISAGQITVTDVVPAGLTPTAATGTGWTCGIVGQTVTCTTTAAIAAAAAAPAITLTVNVLAGAPNSVTNTATVGGGGETNSGNNSASDPTTIVSPAAPDVAITKTHVGNFIALRPGIYTLTVTNQTALPVTGPLVITDTLPSTLTYTSGTGSGWTCGVVGQIVTCTNPGPLAGSASTVVTLTTTVDAAAFPGVTNRAWIAAPGDVNPANDSSTDPTRVESIPDYAITKSAPGSFTIGTNATYTIGVTNISAGPSFAVTTVTDTLPTGLTYVSAGGGSWTCGVTGQIVVCTHPAGVPSGGSVPISLTVAVGAAAAPSVTNRAHVASLGDVNLANNTATATNPVVAAPAPNLAVTKTHTGSFQAGQNGVYNITVSNVGAAATTGAITVTDVLPTGLTFVSGTGTGWTCSAAGQTVTCTNAGPLAPTASTAIVLTVGVSAAAIPSVTNTVTVATPGDADPSNDTAQDPTTVVSIPDLALVKTATSALTVGQNATYQLAVTNVSTGPTTGQITITDVLPAGLSYVSAVGPAWNCSAAGQTVTCTNPGPLVASATTSVTLTVAVGPSAVPSVTNSATVTTPGDLNAGNNTGAVTSPVAVPTSPDLSIAKTHTGTFVAGQNGAYTLTISNVGTASTTGTITVTDPLPVGLTFVTGTGAGWSCGAAGQNVTCTNAGPIAVGGSTAITLTVAVGAAAIPSVTNTASVSTPGDNNAANNTAADPTTVISIPDLTLTKTATTVFTVGQNAGYQLAVSNISPGPTTGAITITDVLPAGLTFVSGTGPGWTCGAAGQTVTCTNAGPIAGGATSNVALTVGVTAPAAPSVTNSATVTTPGDLNPGNNTGAVTTPVGGIALDLAIAKTLVGSMTAGQNATYNLAVSNISLAATTGTTTVSDVLPTGLTLVSASGGGFTCSAAGQTVTCTNAAVISSGQTATIALVVAVAPGLLGPVTNTATVSTPGDVNPANNQSSLTHPVATGIDLSIAKTAGTLQVGQPGGFTITVSNVGVSPTTGNITVIDVLPVGLTYASAAGTGFTCSAAGQVVTCTRTTPMTPGQVVPITLTVNVGPLALPAIVNSVSVATPGDQVPGNNTAVTPNIPVQTAPALAPDLSVSKSLVGPLPAGGNATFRIAVTNVGTGPTTGPITVTDVLQSGLTFVSGTGTGWSCSASGQTVTCTNPGPLAPNASTTVDLVVAVAATVTSVTNTATATTPGDGNGGNDTGTTESTPVTQLPDLTLTKAANGPFLVGQPASYTVTVTNRGNGPTTGLITVTDVVPAGLTVVSATGTGWTCSISGQTVTCTHPGPLAPNGSLTLTINVTPTAAAIPSVTNTASVATPGDANPGNNDGSVTTPVGGVVDLALTKTGADSITAGGQTTYTLSVRNLGTIATTGPIVITDSLPAGLTFVSGSGSGFTCAVSGQIVTCTRTAPPLGAGQVVNVDLTVSVAGDLTGPVRNVACVRTAGDVNTANDCGTKTAAPIGNVDLVATKDVLGALEIGQPGTFTLSVRNAGSTPAAPPITVVDTLPSGLVFVSATGTGWSCSAVANVLTCTRATALPPGAAPLITVTVSVTPAAFPRVTNCMNVRGTNETGTLVNNRSCVDAIVAGIGKLEIEKRASRAEVQIGDVVDYTVIVKNSGNGAISDAIITDQLPPGFLLEAQSVRVGGVAVATIPGAPGPQIVIEVGRINAGQQVVVTYRVRVGPGARPGQSVNVAVASSRSRGEPTPPARATVRVTGGVFDERGAIVGKVFVQCDCEKGMMQDRGEVGIPGVRVFLEDGTSAVTDVEGKYNFYNVASRLHVVKVDRATLPEGAVLVPLVNRNAGDGYTRFADVKAGELHRADFADGSRRREVLDRVIERRRAGEVLNAGEPPVRWNYPGVQASSPASPRDTLRGEARAVYDLAQETGVQGASMYASKPLFPRGLTDNNATQYTPLFGARRLNEGNSQLPVTPLRARQQQRATAAGTERIEITGFDQVMPADGQTLVPIYIRLVGADGEVIARNTDVVIEASVGRWLHTSSVETNSDGYHVTLVNGVGRYFLVAPPTAARGEVRVTADVGEMTIPVTFASSARELLLSGLVNARIDFQKLIRGGLGVSAGGDGFEDALRDWSFEDDSAETRGGARAALLVKGTVLDSRLLTLSYDSERDRGRTFFRDISPNEFFPVYGDGSLREFDAQSRRRFYARLDKGTGYTMYGDFQTTRSDDRRVISSYDRSLTGAVQHFEGRDGSATFFASQGRISQAVDELPGRGISGPYALSRATGLINSERVEIIVRDRNQPSVILTRTPMTRFADYTIEPVTGRILFRMPVQSLDANLNPISIRVTYETENGDSKAFWVYGLDGSVRAGSRLELGGTFARDEGPNTSHQIIGLNATAKLGAATTLFGEFASTQDSAGVNGTAQRVELRHQSSALDARLFAVRSDKEYVNTSSIFSGGRTEIGGRFSRQLAAGTRLVGEALHSELNELDVRRQGAVLSIERQFSQALRGEFGYRFARSNEERITNPLGGIPSIGVGEDRDVSALRGRLQFNLPQQTRTSLFAEAEQDVRESDQRRLAVGGEYIIASRARLYGRHEYLSGLRDQFTPTEGTDRNITVFGIDADYLKNTQMFSEYRARDAFNGRDAEASIGLRNRWAIAPGLLVNTTFERVAPIFDPGISSRRGGDALAVTGAIEWVKPALYKTTARLEFRNAEESGDNFLASFGYARKLSRDWTMLGRTLWDNFNAGQRQTRGFSQFGVAWRETDQNKWNALARYEHRFERLGVSDALGATRDQAHIVAAMVNYQPVQRFTLSSRYAAKRSLNRLDATETSNAAQLMMARGVLDLTNRFDAGLIASSLFSDGFSDRRYGLGGELGLIVMKNLRVAGGYNLFGFTDRDLNSFGTTRKGAYIELGFKFDESLFGIGDNSGTGRTASRGGNR